MAIDWGQLISGIANAGATAYTTDRNAQQVADAAKALQPGGSAYTDIDQLNALAKSIATQNAIDSSNLEKQLTPEVPALRTASNLGVLSNLAPSAGSAASESYLTGQVGQQLNPLLLNQAIAKAKSQLDLGGSIDPETQNLVTRHALANGGSVAGAGGGLGLGRDLAARDLGTTSMALQNSRLQTALGAGQQQLGLQQANASNQFSLASILQQIQGNNFGRNLSAAQYGESIRQPNVGLDPTAVANIRISQNNINAALAAQRANTNIAGNNNNLAAYGSLAGAILGSGVLGNNATSGSNGSASGGGTGSGIFGNAGSGVAAGVASLGGYGVYGGNGGYDPGPGGYEGSGGYGNTGTESPYGSTYNPNGSPWVSDGNGGYTVNPSYPGADNSQFYIIGPDGQPKQYKPTPGE